MGVARGVRRDASPASCRATVAGPTTGIGSALVYGGRVNGGTRPTSTATAAVTGAESD